MSHRTHLPVQGGIRRGPRLADNFTILSNAAINDGRLSFRARGVLMWLLSKPADWRI
ncbi:MAG: replication protein, partial [Acidobacteria bacterium]